MKKYLFVALAAAALAGCTNDEWVDNGTPQDGEDKVPILMSAGLEASVASTKAVVTGTTFPDNTTNLFRMVAYTSNSSFNGTEYFDESSRHDLPVSSRKDDGDNQVLYLTPAQYYDTDASTNLYFYAFAPGDNSWAYTAGATPTATYTIDGSDDVMYAKNTTGYNKTSTNKPNLAFTHLLRKLDFTIKAASGVEPGGAAVKSVSIATQNTKLTLNVTTGAITKWETPTALTVTPPTPVTIPANSAGAATIGSIMCQPAVTVQQEETLQVTVTLNDGNDTQLTGELKLTSPSGGDAGKAYTVNLEYSMKEILATATITDWVSAGGAITVPVQ